jgi:hypothetical protein
MAPRLASGPSAPEHLPTVTQSIAIPPRHKPTRSTIPHHGDCRTKEPAGARHPLSSPASQRSTALALKVGQQWHSKKAEGATGRVHQMANRDARECSVCGFLLLPHILFLEICFLRLRSASAPDKMGTIMTPAKRCRLMLIRRTVRARTRQI